MNRGLSLMHVLDRVCGGDNASARASASHVGCETSRPRKPWEMLTGDGQINCDGIVLCVRHHVMEPCTCGINAWSARHHLTKPAP